MFGCLVFDGIWWHDDDSIFWYEIWQGAVALVSLFKTFTTNHFHRITGDWASEDWKRRSSETEGRGWWLSFLHVFLFCLRLKSSRNRSKGKLFPSFTMMKDHIFLVEELQGSVFFLQNDALLMPTLHVMFQSLDVTGGSGNCFLVLQDGDHGFRIRRHAQGTVTFKCRGGL